MTDEDKMIRKSNTIKLVIAGCVAVAAYFLTSYVLKTGLQK